MAPARRLGLLVELFEHYWASWTRARLLGIQRKSGSTAPRLRRADHARMAHRSRAHRQISQFPRAELEITRRGRSGCDDAWAPRAKFAGRLDQPLAVRAAACITTVVHGRLLFAGDAAHQIPPYARGRQRRIGYNAHTLRVNWRPSSRARLQPAHQAARDLHRASPGRARDAMFACQSQCSSGVDGRAKLFRPTPSSRLWARARAHRIAHTGCRSTAIAHAWALAALAARRRARFTAQARPGVAAVNLPVRASDGVEGFCSTTGKAASRC